MTTTIQPRTPQNKAKQIQQLEKALKHLKEAVTAMNSAPRFDYTEDIPYFRGEIEQIISSDNGQAGLQAFVNRLKQRA